MDPWAHFQALPPVTRFWLGASFLVHLAVTMDVVRSRDLAFRPERILARDRPEPWRILTCFLYGGGTLTDMPVLIGLYMVMVQSSGYERNPFPTGRSSRADYVFCLLCCTAMILGSYLAIRQTDWGKHLLHPRFSHTLTSCVLYLWARRNPNAHVRINMIPVPGYLLPWGHLGISVALGNRIHELLHGYAVGHVFFYLVDVFPVVSGGRTPLSTPGALEDALELLLGPPERHHDHRPRGNIAPPPQRPNTAERLRRLCLERDRATEAHLAAKTGRLGDLRALSGTPGGRASMVATDRNGWQPLHEAARGGHEEVVAFLLGLRARPSGDEDNDENNPPLVDANARTLEGTGPTALWLAERQHGRAHPVCARLREAGGRSLGPAR